MPNSSVSVSFALTPAYSPPTSVSLDVVISSVIPCVTLVEKAFVMASDFRCR